MSWKFFRISQGIDFSFFFWWNLRHVRVLGISQHYSGPPHFYFSCGNLDKPLGNFSGFLRASTILFFSWKLRNVGFMESLQDFSGNLNFLFLLEPEKSWFTASSSRSLRESTCLFSWWKLRSVSFLESTSLEICDPSCLVEVEKC